MKMNYKLPLIAFVLSFMLYAAIQHIIAPKGYAIHVDGQTEYRRYSYDCDSVLNGYAYRDGLKIKLAGKSEYFFNEKK